jgi:protein involved in polysaccharide export with SLBB domain
MGNRVAVSSKLPNNNDDASPPRTRTATPDSTVPPRNATRKTGERVNAPAAITTTTIAATSVNPSVTPTDAKALYDLGIEYAGAGRYEEAVAAYRRSIVLDNNDAETYFALGTAYTKLGRWRESVDAYEQVVRLNPKDAEAYERLGRSYAKLRETSSPNTTPGTTADGGEAAVGIKAASSSGASSNGTTEPRSERTTTMTDGAARPATNMTRIMNRTASNTTTTNAPPPSSASAARMASNNSSQPANAATTATDNFDPSAVYRVGPGDVLEVNVRNGRASAVTAHAVTTAGLLDYPSLAEPLEVAGLTTDEIASRLTAQLQRRANASAAAPQVAVGVRDYVSHAIIVSGLVKDSGTKILRREGVPLYVVVASAQPLPEAGRALVMSHATNRSTTIDLSDARAMNMLVRPGDVITVQASTKQYFYIAGAIRQPGQKEFHVGLTLTQAILAAGGVMSPQSSSSTVVNIARQGADGRLATTRYDIKDIEAGKVPDPGLQPGDRIEVAR